MVTSVEITAIDALNALANRINFRDEHTLSWNFTLKVGQRLYMIARLQAMGKPGVSRTDAKSAPSSNFRNRMRERDITRRNLACEAESEH
jgi:hypothetical protein